MKPRYLDKLMAEVALYGGIPLRRADILAAATRDLGADAREPFGAMYFALHGPAVDMEPWGLDAFQKLS